MTLGRLQLIQHMQNREGEVNGIDGRTWSTQPFRRSWIALSGAPECLYAGHPVTTIADFIAADLGNA
jgi:hypothetical protein